MPRQQDCAYPICARAAGGAASVAQDFVLSGLRLRRAPRYDRGMSRFTLCLATILSCGTSFAAGDPRLTLPRTGQMHAAPVALRTLAHRSAITHSTLYCFISNDGPILGLVRPPTEAEQSLAHGELMMLRGEFDRAATDFSNALFYQPKFAMALADRGAADISLDNLPQAREDLAAALTIDPHNSMALRSRGVVAVKEGRYGDAVAAYTASLDSEPGNVFAQTRRAAAYDLMGDEARALAASTALTQQHPELGDPYEFRAQIYWRAGHPEAAVREAEAALAANPNSAEAFKSAAVIYSLTGNDAESEQDFRKSIALHPTDAAYLARAAARPAWDRAGREADLIAARRANPRSTRALLALTAFLRDVKRYSDAVKELSSALQVRVDYPTFRAERGTDEALLGQADLAAEDLAAARAKARGPEDHNQICWRQAVAGVFLTEALADCDTALAEIPENPEYLDSRGMVLLRLGRFGESITSYSAALRKRSDFPFSLYGRAMAEIRRGDTKAAAADTARATFMDRGVADRFAAYGVRPP